jgi:hypothetical protein
MLDQEDDARDSVSEGGSDGSCDESPRPLVHGKRKKTQLFPSMLYMVSTGESLAIRTKHLFGIGKCCQMDVSVFSVIEIFCHCQSDAKWLSNMINKGMSKT